MHARPNVQIEATLRWLGTLLGLVLAACLFAASPAAASYELTETFGKSGEGRFQNGVPTPPTGMAININGAGGVAPGTVYVASGARVERFTAQGEFREAWGWGVAEEAVVAHEFQRCGPEGELLHPACRPGQSHGPGSIILEGTPPGLEGEEGLGQFVGTPSGVAVDQQTGDVYVIDARNHDAVQVFTADGEIIGGFAERSKVFGETIEESPEMLHRLFGEAREGIGVSASSGDVYITDSTTGFESRIMAFRPRTPGDYADYDYAGRSADLANGAGVEYGATVDEAGNLYVANFQEVLEFDPSQQNTPICRTHAHGQIDSFTVNPGTGEVFYHDFTGGKIHQLGRCETAGCATDLAPAPFLTLPTSCNGPLNLTVQAEALEDPGVLTPPFVVQSLDPGGNPAGLTGCEKPPFEPTLTTRPETAAADTPTGLAVDLGIPQNDGPEQLASANLKNAVVSLPRGLVVNPSAANGLSACTEAEVDLHSAAVANCPEASKIGSVSIDTPLLDHPLPGAVYLAKQGENPFGSLLALYIAVDDPITGIVVKLPGKVQPDPITGQLAATFDENPELPFENLKIDFFGGPRAPLSTPSTCGLYTTSSDLTPWTSPAGADADTSDTFQISSGAAGAACATSETQLPNSPSFEAGTVTPLAGAFSPFVFKVSREDGSQRFGSITGTLPEGMLGKLAGVPYCSEAQIAAATARSGEGEGALEQASPSCPVASQVGVVNITAGSGPQPYPVQGKAYLAGPYKNAPLSLAIVTPAIAGPFDLGTVVVRVALYINSSTSQVSAVSDPIPTILDGIPLDIRSVSLNMNRAGFTFNPTSCEAMSVTGQAISTLGQAAALSNRFQVGGCQGLPFKPSFTSSTVGKASKTGGASLTVKISQKPGEADIHKVDLTLPKALPARLTTLQKACTEAQFNANPAACPAGAFIGTATAVTPVLSVPLTGPAILVSHGRRGVPRRRVPPAGRRTRLGDPDRPGRQDRHQEGRHVLSFRNGPRRADHELRNELPPGSPFDPRHEPPGKREVQPLWAEALDPDRDHRPERRAGHAVHADRRDGLLDLAVVQTQDQEAEADAQGLRARRRQDHRHGQGPDQEAQDRERPRNPHDHAQAKARRQAEDQGQGHLHPEHRHDPQEANQDREAEVQAVGAPDRSVAKRTGGSIAPAVLRRFVRDLVRSRVTDIWSSSLLPMGALQELAVDLDIEKRTSRRAVSQMADANRAIRELAAEEATDA